MIGHVQSIQRLLKGRIRGDESEEIDRIDSKKSITQNTHTHHVKRGKGKDTKSS